MKFGPSIFYVCVLLLSFLSMWAVGFCASCTGRDVQCTWHLKIFRVYIGVQFLPQEMCWYIWKIRLGYKWFKHTFCDNIWFLWELILRPNKGYLIVRPECVLAVRLAYWVRSTVASGFSFYTLFIPCQFK